MKKIMILIIVVLLLLLAGTLCRGADMVSPESWITHKVEIKTNSMFAKEKIDKGELIAIFGGKIVTRSQVAHLSQEQMPNLLQIEDDFWIISSAAQHDPVNCINHSCAPNAGMKGQLSLVAMHDIEPGKEVTFDFAMVVSEWIGMEAITCKCGAVDCRKIVGKDDWKSEKLQQKYKGYFSSYLEKKMQ